MLRRNDRRGMKGCQIYEASMGIEKPLVVYKMLVVREWDTPACSARNQLYIILCEGIYQENEFYGFITKQ